MFRSIAICAAITFSLISPAAAQDETQSPDATTTAAAAGEVPQAVKDACKDDYEKLCSAHEPESAAARDCMAGAFEKLSDPCVTAILDSPLVEQEQQRLANAPASDQNGAEGPKSEAAKSKTHSAHVARKATDHKAAAQKESAAKPATRTAKATHAVTSKYVAHHSKRHFAQRANGPSRSVATHIRRGTGIANYYVAKYTRFAFAKAFR